MKRTILVCVAAVAFAGSAWAQNAAQGQSPGQKDAKPTTGAPAQGGAKDAKPSTTTASPAQGEAMDMTKMDMTKMGPMARKPTNEKQTKKEVMDFFKQQEEAEKKGDIEAMLTSVDRTVFMVTDDMKGIPESKEYSREEYAAMMKPMFENMPKDMKTTHKPTITVLSDSLVAVTDNFTMMMGKQKITGTNAGLLVKRDGQWKWKTMVEAGWGGMGSGGSGQTPVEGKK